MRTLADGLAAALDDWRGAWPLASSEDALAALLRIAGALPVDFLLHQVGFEGDLARDDAPLDLLVAARIGQGGPALLARAAAQADPAGTDPGWNALRDLLAHWTRPAWRRRTDHWWLEFDAAGTRPRTPSLFVGMAVPRDDARRWQAWRARWMPRLLGTTPTPQLRDDFERCVQALPDAARLFQIGAMRARADAGLRLCIGNLYLDAILDYLPRLGIDHDAALRAECIALQRHADGFVLHIDLPLRASARIGLECYQREAPDDALSRRWDGLLAYLGERGLCGERQRRAVAAFPRVVDAPADDDGAWPSAALRLQALSGRRSALRRRVHHVKLDFVDGRATRAKAYLGIDPAWR